MLRVLAFLPLLLAILTAQADAYMGPEICGYLDIGVRAGLEDEANTDGILGALEVNVEGEISDWASYAAGVVLEKEGVEVGADFAATFFDLHLPEKDGFFTTGGVYLGLFDTPFGWDFLRCATPDRLTISVPLTTEIGFDGGMGELGFTCYARTTYFELDAYMLYFPFEEPIDEENPGVPDRWGYGARLDVLPGMDWLHLGGSVVIMNEGVEDDDVETQRFGGHVHLEQWGLEITGEFVMGSDGVDTVVDSQGYYAELVYHFDEVFAPLYLFARYGTWDPDTAGGNSELTRIVGGLGYRPIEWLTFKLEYTANDEPGDIKNDSLTLDAVVSF